MKPEKSFKTHKSVRVKRSRNDSVMIAKSQARELAVTMKALGEELTQKGACIAYASGQINALVEYIKTLGENNHNSLLRAKRMIAEHEKQRKHHHKVFDALTLSMLTCNSEYHRLTRTVLADRNNRL